MSFIWLRGNHDILPPSVYKKSVLKIHEEPIIIGPFIFSHEPEKKQLPGFFNICGHIHPGVLLKGKARQFVRIPCFYWTGHNLILPSFGNFTGLALIHPKVTDSIWGISGEKVIPILSGGCVG